MIEWNEKQIAAVQAALDARWEDSEWISAGPVMDRNGEFRGLLQASIDRTIPGESMQGARNVLAEKGLELLKNDFLIRRNGQDETIYNLITTGVLSDRNLEAEANARLAAAIEEQNKLAHQEHGQTPQSWAGKHGRTGFGNANDGVEQHSR